MFTINLTLKDTKAQKIHIVYNFNIICLYHKLLKICLG